ncbi:hypothetical protein MP228_004226 [Amoeboaphelidium protococcarum]|nr:hypothetical protein MP228_004226 [Amoeboaphelidium protococcarum]
MKSEDSKLPSFDRFNVVRLVLIFLGIKILLFPAYASTDFEVHRNWLAITHSTPLQEWYFENTSEWTLDYPPFFAWFEYAMSQFAVYFEPEMLIVSNLNYRSDRAVLFQRVSVIVSELLLLTAILRICKDLSNDAAKWLLLFGTYCSVGLLIVDHIHFQYNGFLLGIFTLAIHEMSRNNFLLGGFYFAALLNFKHIFLYVAPAFFIYILRNYCMSQQSYQPKLLNFIKISLVVVLVTVTSLWPFRYQLPQLMARLFPFKRGLVHAYWAPNFYALYSFADKIFCKVLQRSAQSANTASGIVQETVFCVLPQISPKATFLLTLISHSVPLYRLWKRPEYNQFVLTITLCALGSFMFGWHVHEKAILLALFPLCVYVSYHGSQYVKKLLWLLQVSGYLGLLPLLYRLEESPIKILAFIIYTAVSFKFCGLRLGDFTRIELVFICLSLFVIAFESSSTVITRETIKFLPLMLTSVYCAVGVSYSWLLLMLFNSSVAVKVNQKWSKQNSELQQYEKS